MGISGLLPFVKDASKKCHIRKFSGCTVAIDAYCWLHKGSFGCAEKLGKGEPTDAYIKYCMKYLQMLLDNKIKPILVLDGRNLPSKEHTEKERRAKRTENRNLARKYLQEGNKKKAWECFTKCVDITPAMAREFIKQLRIMKIDYVVAPYEADAQLAHLALTGVADLIITEDSDLILFGCPKIFFKMNVNGDGVFFDASNISKCINKSSKSQFEFYRFRWMCILSGCDYLQNCPGIGLGRAKQVLFSSNHTDIRQMLMSIPSALNGKVSVDITEEYIMGFIRAENTFLHQLVFDTKTRKVMPLNPYPENVEVDDLKYAGKYEDPTLALGLALGNVDLHSLKTVDSFEPLKSGYNATSIWSPAFQQKSTNVIEMKASPIGFISSKISNKIGNIKKRSLSITEADNSPGDWELMNMYSESTDSTTKTSGSDDETASSNDLYASTTKANFDSPASSKRRRLVKLEDEENDTNNVQQARSTRSRSRSLPFLKSPENPKVHVKSKYFRTVISEAATKIEDATMKVSEIDSMSEHISQDDINENETEEDFLTPPSSLNIYSSSQETNYTDVSASQSSFSSASLQHCSGESIKDSEELPNEFEEAVAVITLDEDNDDLVVEDTDIAKSIEKSPISQRSTRYSGLYASSPYFSSSNSSGSSQKSLEPIKPGRDSRRQGLSKTTKKNDPKQRSVRDMFIRKAQVGKS